MDNISNFLFNLDESQNIEKNQHNAKTGITNANEGQTLERSSPSDFQSNSLKQGTNFNNYQNKKISKASEESNPQLIEGFTGTQLAEKSNNVLKETEIREQDKKILENLKLEYQKTLEQYNSILNSIENNSKKYIERTNTNNPYLNKTIKFTTGHVCYVTNEGVVKYIPSRDIWNSTNAPKEVINLNIPWLGEYNRKGANIATNPPLITGTHVKKGQIFGNEGKNIRVNSIIQNKNATNKGCYVDDFENPTLTYIGDKPPRAPQNIMNGNFNTPQLNRNTFRTINSNEEVVGWNFNATLMNRSSAWGYRIPYPFGNQAVSLQNRGYMSQKLFLVKGDYELSFSLIGRRTQNGPNTVNVYLSNKQIFSLKPPSDRWRGYSAKFNIENDGDYEIKFEGQNTSGDRSTAVQNVVLKYNKTSSGSFTLEQCKESAINMFYKFFGLQDYNNKTGKGYCAVTNEPPIYNCNSNTSNRIYELNEVGVKNNLGKVAYIDGNSDLFPYSSLKLTNTYSTIKNLDNSGNRLINIQNTNVENCQTECNKNNNCYGFSFNNSNNSCDLKNGSIFPKTSSNVDFNTDLYLRDKTPTTFPAGISNTIINTNTYSYENYNDGTGKMQEFYGLKSINSVKMQELQQLRTKLDILSKDIVEYADKFGNNNDKVLLQSKENIKGLNNFVRDIKNVNKNISTFDTNHENILNESDILVLKENYNYMFWSILAIGSVLLAMNIQ
jgi:hypothetical protein